MGRCLQKIDGFLKRCLFSKAGRAPFFVSNSLCVTPFLEKTGIVFIYKVRKGVDKHKQFLIE